MTNVNMYFEQAFAQCTQEIAFNPAWHNGTGYFDNCAEGAKAPAVCNGTPVKCISDDGRKIIILGTIAGRVVVFQRHAQAPTSAIVLNVADDVKDHFDKLIPSSALTLADLKALFGDKATGSKNVGGGEGMSWTAVAEPAVAPAAPDMVAAFAAAMGAKARADAVKAEAAWYNCTTAKVVGGTALVAAVAAGAYYGWKAYNKA